MKINEILVESQQLDEGPFTQAVGKVGGKIAKGIAGVGKDLKTGFKAGYSGEEPPAGSEPIVKKPGLLKKIGQAVGDFKAGFKQGSGQASNPSVQPATSSTPAATNSNPVPVAAAAADTAAEKQSKIGVGQINKIIPTLRTRDLLSLQANLEKAIASKKQKSTPVVNPEQPPAQQQQPVVKSRSKKPVNITGNKQVDQTQKQMASKEPNSNMVAESFSIFRKH